MLNKYFGRKKQYFGDVLDRVIEDSFKTIYPTHLRQQALATAVIYVAFLCYAHFLNINNPLMTNIVILICVCFAISILSTAKNLKKAAFYLSGALSVASIVFAGMVFRDSGPLMEALPGIAGILLITTLIGNRYSTKMHLATFLATLVYYNLFIFRTDQAAISMVEFHLLYATMFLVSLFLIHEMNAQEIRLITTRYKLEKNEIAWNQIGEELLSTQKTLEKENTHDFLTGVFNKQHFIDTILKRKLANTKGSDYAFYVAMMDLDYFKAINDKYGHQAGDQAIKQFAHVLEDEIRRDMGVIGRYAGDEFMVIFDPIEIESLKAVIGRIQIRLKAAYIKNVGTVGLSVSIGMVKVSDGKFKDPDEVIKGADAQLSLVKESGKGSFLIHE